MAGDTIDLIYFQASIRDNDPVVFLENELSYNEIHTLTVEQQSPDFVLPIGKAKIEVEGSDITLISFSRQVGNCIKVAQQLKQEGISVEVSIISYGLLQSLFHCLVDVHCCRSSTYVA